VATDVKGNITTLPVNLRPAGSTTAMNLNWDSDNKLRSAEIDANGTADVNFQYDSLGRRVARSGTGGSVVYVQMDQQTIADYPVGGAATTPTFRYVYASYIDEPVVRKTAGTGGTLVYFHRNHQYSVTAVTTSAGAIAERYAYTAYGLPTILDASGLPLTPQSSTLSNRYTYTAREWDATLGLHHFRARWMSPSAGRFLTRDPIGYVDGLSLYRVYFHSQSADPLGEYQVTVQTNAFIPYGLLMIDPWSDVEGDDRDVSFEPLGPESSRAFSRAVVEMEECIQKDPLVSSSSTISDSHMRTWNGHEERRFTARGGFRAKVTAVRTGPCSVQVHMQMHAWLPFIFVPMAPAIDWDLTYDLHFFEIEGHGVRVTGNLSGSHDGFPAYEDFVQGKRVYDHDPRLTGDWIASLFPPMEYSPNKSFMVVDSNGKASCCGCKEKNPLAP
jgi:RHS repeat-associated protein